jgi:hypothetical protein
MADEEYEILPHEEIEHLRREVEKLKKSPYGETGKGQTLLDSMERLTNSINRLVKLLEEVEEEVIEEYEKNKPPAHQMNKLLDQNEKIAQGIVTLADMMKKKEEPVEQTPPVEQIPPAQPTTQPEEVLTQAPPTQPEPTIPEQIPDFSEAPDFSPEQETPSSSPIPDSQPLGQPVENISSPVSHPPVDDIPLPPGKRKGLFRK